MEFQSAWPSPAAFVGWLKSERTHWESCFENWTGSPRDDGANSWYVDSHRQHEHRAPSVFYGNVTNKRKVLIAGGAGTGTSAELYDSSTGTWTPTGSMSASRALHTATLPTDGKVIVAGGQDIIVNSSAELYDPDTGLWTPTGRMNVPRSAHMATLIAGGPLSGMVIVAAGNSDSAPSSNAAELSSSLLRCALD